MLFYDLCMFETIWLDEMTTEYYFFDICCRGSSGRPLGKRHRSTPLREVLPKASNVRTSVSPSVRPLELAKLRSFSNLRTYKLLLRLSSVCKPLVDLAVRRAWNNPRPMTRQRIGMKRACLCFLGRGFVRTSHGCIRNCRCRLALYVPSFEPKDWR